MTKKDFELIAGAIAAVEADYKGDFREILSEIVEELANRLERDHPRFKRGTFKAACLPLKYDDLKQAILVKLGQS